MTFWIPTSDVLNSWIFAFFGPLRRIYTKIRLLLSVLFHLRVQEFKGTHTPGNDCTLGPFLCHLGAGKLKRMGPRVAPDGTRHRARVPGWAWRKPRQRLYATVLSRLIFTETLAAFDALFGCNGPLHSTTAAPTLVNPLLSVHGSGLWSRSGIPSTRTGIVAVGGCAANWCTSYEGPGQQVVEKKTEKFPVRNPGTALAPAIDIFESGRLRKIFVRQMEDDMKAESVAPHHARRREELAYLHSWLVKVHPEQLDGGTEAEFIERNLAGFKGPSLEEVLKQLIAKKSTAQEKTGWNGQDQDRVPEDCWHCRGTLVCDCIYCHERNRGGSTCAYCPGGKAAIGGVEVRKFESVGANEGGCDGE